MHAGIVDRTGIRYGKLIALELDSVRGVRGMTHWICQCDCGKTTRVSSGNLSTGRTKSCGCHKIEVLSGSKTKYDMVNSPTYITWQSMKKRCTNVNDNSYGKYGGVGIGVCDRWLESFENFFEDMGERPEGMTLNRVNGARVYSKETCEWATLSVQSFDTRKQHNNKSGKTGVFQNHRGKWVAYIDCERRINLGTFSSKEDAIAARMAAEIKYFGFTKE